MTVEKAFVLVSGIIFVLLSLLHVVRLAFRLRVRVESRELPIGVSVVGLALGAGMAAWAFWLLL